MPRLSPEQAELHAWAVKHSDGSPGEQWVCNQIIHLLDELAEVTRQRDESDAALIWDAQFGSYFGEPGFADYKRALEAARARQRASTQTEKS